jgi:phospholipid-binding lipoprotein MlaA
VIRMPGKARTKHRRCAQGWVQRATACILPLLMTACATMSRDASLPISDPSEATNREVLAANERVLGPLSEAVNATIPGPVHDRLHDLNSNLKEPRIFANNVLQLRPDAAARTAGRFILKTTFGIGGSRSRAVISGRLCLCGGSAKVPTWWCPIWVRRRRAMQSAPS